MGETGSSTFIVVKLVPKAQPEGSQTRSVWESPAKVTPSQRDGGNTALRICSYHKDESKGPVLSRHVIAA